MKATGIVRRVDDLGRVVIPKEIRRTMRIVKRFYLTFFASCHIINFNISCRHGWLTY